MKKNNTTSVSGYLLLTIISFVMIVIIVNLSVFFISKIPPNNTNTNQAIEKNVDVSAYMVGSYIIREFTPKSNDGYFCIIGYGCYPKKVKR